MSAPHTSAAPGSASTPRWGMVIDLNRCVGCQTCTIACKHTNDTPPGIQWRQVLDIETGVFPDVERLFLVVGCQHCAEPPCVPVCPSGATRQRDDGLVTMDYDTCIGCGYCAVACPYQARTIAHEKQWYYGKETAQERAVAHDDRIRVAQKCTFCVEKIDRAKELGLTPGIDLDVTPACSASCIAQAITFGDFNDSDSNVSQLLNDHDGFQMHQELGTDPQIRYLYETPAVPGRAPDEDEFDDERLADPANPLVGKRQTFWDFRAAMNFTMGGMSSGLAIVAWLSYLLGGTPERTLIDLFVVAAVMMATGLFFVFLEISRKLRFLNVLLRPQSSWMTRETYVVAVLYPALAADYFWPHAALHALIAVSAAAFLYCQARILHAGKGIPAWRVPLMPYMLVATGLFEGVGLLSVAQLIVPDRIDLGSGVSALGVLLALLNAGLWQLYRALAPSWGIGPLARRVLKRATSVLHILGHLLPVALYVLALAFPWRSEEALIAVGVAGAGAVFGGIWWKFTVITRACHQQGFALPRLPQRGSGRRAAPPRLQPEL